MSKDCAYLCTYDGDPGANLAVADEGVYQKEKERTYGPVDGAGPDWGWCCDCGSARGDVSMASWAKWTSLGPEKRRKNREGEEKEVGRRERAVSKTEQTILLAELHNAPRLATSTGHAIGVSLGPQILSIVFIYLLCNSR